MYMLIWMEINNQPQKEFRPPMTEIQEALMCILQEHRVVRGYTAADGTEVDPVDRSFRSSNSRFFASPTLSYLSIWTELAQSVVFLI